MFSQPTSVAMYIHNNILSYLEFTHIVTCSILSTQIATSYVKVTAIVNIAAIYCSIKMIHSIIGLLEKRRLRQRCPLQSGVWTRVNTTLNNTIDDQHISYLFYITRSVNREITCCY